MARRISIRLTRRARQSRRRTHDDASRNSKTARFHALEGDSTRPYRGYYASAHLPAARRPHDWFSIERSHTTRIMGMGVGEQVRKIELDAYQAFMKVTAVTGMSWVRSRHLLPERPRLSGPTTENARFLRRSLASTNETDATRVWPSGRNVFGEPRTSLGSRETPVPRTNLFFPPSSHLLFLPRPARTGARRTRDEAETRASHLERRPHAYSREALGR